MALPSGKQGRIYLLHSSTAPRQDIKHKCATEHWMWSSACAQVALLQTPCLLLHLQLPWGNSASTSIHCSSAQLVLLKELMTAVLYTVPCLTLNTGCIHFLNAVLSVTCPKIHYSSTYKGSLPVLCLPLLLQEDGTGQAQTHSSCTAGSASSPHSLPFWKKIKNSAVIHVDTWVTTVNKKSLTLLLAEETRLLPIASQCSHLTIVVHTQFCRA